MTTRRTTMSARRLAAENSDTYRQTWIGKQAVFTSWDGTRTVGTITRFTPNGMYPCVTFPDGTWARLDREVEIVNG